MPRRLRSVIHCIRSAVQGARVDGHRPFASSATVRSCLASGRRDHFEIKQVAADAKPMMGAVADALPALKKNPGAGGLRARRLVGLKPSACPARDRPTSGTAPVVLRGTNRTLAKRWNKPARPRRQSPRQTEAAAVSSAVQHTASQGRNRQCSPSVTARFGHHGGRIPRPWAGGLVVEVRSRIRGPGGTGVDRHRQLKWRSGPPPCRAAPGGAFCSVVRAS